jgi:hypothetical protein
VNYIASYMACGLLFLIAPPAGFIMMTVTTACLLDELISRTQRVKEITYTTPPDPKRCRYYNPDGPTPCHHPHCNCFGGLTFPTHPVMPTTPLVFDDSEMAYACRCHRVLGNDYYFLPRGSCLYEKCDNDL